MSEVEESPQRRALIGGIYLTLTFVAWGFSPIYFKAVSHIGAWEVLAHRIVWSLLMMAALVRMRGRWPVALELWRNPVTRRALIIAACLVTSNWGLFIWAVANNQVLQASLAYYINPLFSVVLAVVLLGERLRKAQAVAAGLAGLAVVWMVLSAGVQPWIALCMATTFSIYALLHKKHSLPGLAGMLVETAVLLPPAIAMLIYLALRSQASFGAGGWGISLLLTLAGPMTALPLVWFAEGTRRVNLATVGFFQYIAPTGHFLLAVFVYREPMNTQFLMAFMGIWLALAVFTADAWFNRRRPKALPFVATLP